MTQMGKRKTYVQRIIAFIDNMRSNVGEYESASQERDSFEGDDLRLNSSSIEGNSIILSGESRFEGDSIIL